MRLKAFVLTSLPSPAEMYHQVMQDNNLPQNDSEIPEVVEIPITGTIDLHTFHPREISDLLSEYLKECIERGIFEVTIIHGKGAGVLRERVHRFLSSCDFVADFRLADARSGGWGATVTILKKPDKAEKND